MIVESVILSHEDLVLSSCDQMLKSEGPDRFMAWITVVVETLPKNFSRRLEVFRYLVCLQHVVEWRWGA